MTTENWKFTVNLWLKIILEFRFSISIFSINALRDCVYIYIRQLSSSRAPTLWFMDLTVATCHIQYTFLRLRQWVWMLFEYFCVLSVFSWNFLAWTHKGVLNMASGDSQIDKPQRGCPERAELPEVNINTGAQSINNERASLNLLLQKLPLCLFIV